MDNRHLPPANPGRMGPAVKLTIFSPAKKVFFFIDLSLRPGQWAGHPDALQHRDTRRSKCVQAPQSEAANCTIAAVRSTGGGFPAPGKVEIMLGSPDAREKSLPVVQNAGNLAAVSTKLKVILAKAVLAASPTPKGHPAETRTRHSKALQANPYRPAEPTSRLNRILPRAQNLCPACCLSSEVPTSQPKAPPHFCAHHWLPCSRQVLAPRPTKGPRHWNV